MKEEKKWNKKKIRDEKNEDEKKEEYTAKDIILTT